MRNPFMRLVALTAFAALFSGAGEAEAAQLNTADFTAACVADPIVTEDPGFDGSEATPKSYCECVAGKLEASDLSQADVDMLTKLHKEEISDEDVESHPTLDDLLVANEGFEDACKESLGLAIDEGTDFDDLPMEDDMVPDDAMPEDDGSPPE